MTAAVIDTDLAIAFIQGKSEAGRAFERERSAGRPVASAVTVYELVASGGSLSPARLGARRAFLADLEIAPLTQEVAERGGEIVRELRGRGADIGAFDPLIAATALVLNRRLLTRNERHFRRIPGLQVERW